MLRYTLLGKRMRALSDDLDLAETSGIDTARVILYTWIFAGGARRPGRACSPARSRSLQPELGFELLLPIFAAVILGGIGDAFGALAGGHGARARDRVVDAGHRRRAGRSRSASSS